MELLVRFSVHFQRQLVVEIDAHFQQKCSKYGTVMKDNKVQP